MNDYTHRGVPVLAPLKRGYFHNYETIYRNMFSFFALGIFSNNDVKFKITTLEMIYDNKVPDEMIDEIKPF